METLGTCEILQFSLFRLLLATTDASSLQEDTRCCRGNELTPGVCEAVDLCGLMDYPNLPAQALGMAEVCFACNDALATCPHLSRQLPCQDLRRIQDVAFSTEGTCAAHRTAVQAEACTNAKSAGFHVSVCIAVFQLPCRVVGVKHSGLAARYRS